MSNDHRNDNGGKTVIRPNPGGVFGQPSSPSGAPRPFNPDPIPTQKSTTAGGDVRHSNNILPHLLLTVAMSVSLQVRDMTRPELQPRRMHG